MKMNRLIIFCTALLLTSCVSLKKQFIKKPIESAELCYSFYPTKKIEVKEKLTFKSDTVFIKGEVFRCPDLEIKKDTLINGVKETTTKTEKGKEFKCPPNKTIDNSTHTEKEVIVRDSSLDAILISKESLLIEKDIKISDLKKDVSNRNKIIFWVLLINSIYILFRVGKSYIKNKIKR